MLRKNFPSLLISAFIIILSQCLVFSEEWYDPTEYNRTPVVSISPVFIMPMDKFSDIYRYGYGAMVDIGYTPGRLTGFHLSFRTGLIILVPEDETDDMDTGVGDSYILPMLANIEYRFSPILSLKFTPYASAGVSVNRASYDDRSDTISGGVPTGYTEDEDRNVMSVEPLVEAGLKIFYQLGIRDSIFMSSGISTIIESENYFCFITAGIGYERRF